MARKPDPVRLPVPKLTKPRDEVTKHLEERIAKGKELLSLPIPTSEALEQARSTRTRWSDFNATLLERVFDNRVIADEYQTGPLFWSAPINPSHGELVEMLREGVSGLVTKLESVRDRLPLFEEGDLGTSARVATPAIDRNKVFIVYGHRPDALQAVARFVEKLKLTAIVLDEQPHAGQTIIEKIETYSAVGFAVVLVTADDVGAAKADSANLKPRARQNVLLELGYFVGKLGRRNVAVLYETTVELPSDLLGVGWIGLDKTNDWQFRLAREMKAAGLRIDVNDAL